MEWIERSNKNGQVSGLKPTKAKKSRNRDGQSPSTNFFPFLSSPSLQQKFPKARARMGWEGKSKSHKKPMYVGEKAKHYPSPKPTSRKVQKLGEFLSIGFEKST